MTEISFTSTYRIPITQAGVNSAKKAKLKELVLSYPNGLCGNSKVGNARVSIPDSEDDKFIQKLKQIGYKIYQKFEGENIPKEELDAFIKRKLDTRNYSQKGKNIKRFPQELKEKRRFEKNYTMSAYDRLLQEFSEGVSAETKTAAEEAELLTARRPKSNMPIIEIPEEEIRKSPDYLQCVEDYGKEFAEAVYFNLK